MKKEVRLQDRLRLRWGQSGKQDREGSGVKLNLEFELSLRLTLILG